MVPNGVYNALNQHSVCFNTEYNGGPNISRVPLMLHSAGGSTNVFVSTECYTKNINKRDTIADCSATLTAKQQSIQWSSKFPPFLFTQSKWPHILLCWRSKPRQLLINSKETDPVELRQFGDKHSEQGNGVDDEVDPVILCIETGQEIPVEGKDKDKIKSDVR